MKYNYNLYNKLVFSKYNQVICRGWRMCFRNRVNRLNRSSHLKPVTTARRFNY